MNEWNGMEWNGMEWNELYFAPASSCAPILEQKVDFELVSLEVNFKLTRASYYSVM